jgi:hypothetical protein
VVAVRYLGLIAPARSAGPHRVRNSRGSVVDDNWRLVVRDFRCGAELLLENAPPRREY